MHADSRNAGETELSQEKLRCEYRNGDKIIANGTLTVGVPTGYEYSMQGMIVSPARSETTDAHGPVYQ